jgi:class 3 adenylate cyclase
MHNGQLVETPETQYAVHDGVHLAYQVTGEGPIDIVFAPGFVTNVELQWEFPVWAYEFRRVSQFARVVQFDKRGTGLSDRELGTASLEERMDDMRAVMDAAEVERGALIGASEGGPMAMLFAATYPDRVSALVLRSSFACVIRDDQAPWAVPRELFDDFVDHIEKQWGTGASMGYFYPDGNWTDDERQLVARYERNSASPSGAAAVMRLNADIDVRDALPTIQAPTLVIHFDGDPVVSVEHGRYLARTIPGARLLELHGGHHGPANLDEVDWFVDPIQEFLTGSVAGAEPDRVLATVLFTDIVASTETAARVGDRQWRAALDAHDAAIRQELKRFNGTEIKTTGDGFLATFDGPARAIRCAIAIQNSARRLGLEVRCGLHTGEVELRAGGDIGGIAVHIGQRVSSLAGPGEVLVSRTVVDLVAGAGIKFEDRGEHELKGVPGRWSVFAVA